MEIKEVPDDLSSLHRAALETMCQNFLNHRAEPVNQDSNSATTPLSPQKGKCHLLLAYVHTSPISFVLASNKGNRRCLGAGQPCACLRLASHAGVFRELVFRPSPQLYFDTLIQVSCCF